MGVEDSHCPHPVPSHDPMNEARQTLDRLLADYRLAESQTESETKALVEAESSITHAIEAQQFIQNVAERVQRIAHERVAGVVTRCLESVFGEGSFEFKIDFQQKRGRTEARLLFVRNGKEEDPLDASCGGAIDVASFALRLACLVLSRPKKRLFLCLDEPMKSLSREYRPTMRELLETLCDEMGLQILMVTHAKELACGKIIEIGKVVEL